MADRPLNPDEAELWRRVVESVRPAAGRSAPAKVVMKPVGAARAARPTIAAVLPKVKLAPAPQTLDGSWDRQLASGAVVPDRTIDLHGDTLDRAYARVDAGLAAAEQGGERVVLLVTGKPRARSGTGRGAIRAVVGDWLAASRHAGRIAAVRPAHPRHGGAGALYVILRRR